MTLERIGHSYQYETENICRLFFPFSQLGEEDGVHVVTSLEKQPGGLLCRAVMQVNEKSVCKEAHIAEESDSERVLCVLIFDGLCQLTGRRPPWGAQTGVRPVKYLSRLIKELGKAEADAFFRENLRVLPQKIDLCHRVIEIQRPMMDRLTPNRFGLYVSIPFCPTRCSYCSFVSHSMDKAKKLIPDYVKHLGEEIRNTGELAAKRGMILDSVYFGGGTPTVLQAEELGFLMDQVSASFDLSQVAEYTVEAGRSDTITEEKLACIREKGCDRISVNPQSFEDSVLQAIGRCHTGQQAIDAFLLARTYGFSTINMDLIAGLPSDTSAGFADTLKTALQLRPENLTVHTLSAKRASRMTYRGERGVEGVAGEMVDRANEALSDAGYEPYYLYRQSRQSENLENIGWTLPGHESFYNVYIMDECQTILACGAGASTKLVRGENQIDRVFNYKFPYEYIERFGTVLERKEQAFAILDQREE